MSLSGLFSINQGSARSGPLARHIGASRLHPNSEEVPYLLAEATHLPRRMLRAGGKSGARKAARAPALASIGPDLP